MLSVRMVTGLTTPRSGRHSNRDRRNRDNRDRPYRDDRDRGYRDDRDRDYGDDHERRNRDDRPRGRWGRKRRGRGRIRRLVRKPWVRVVLGGFGVFLLVVSWSVGHALTVPGGGSVSERLAEWARDHWLSPVVTFGEWLSYSPPKKGGKPSFALTGPSEAAGRQSPAVKKHTVSYGPPPRLKSLAGKPLPGEGVWRVLGSVDGHPAIYGTYLRSSSIYTSYVAGIASMNQNLLKFELRPGTEDPGP